MHCYIVYTHTHTRIGVYVGTPANSLVKNSPANAGDTGNVSGPILGLGRSPGVGNSNSL